MKPVSTTESNTALVQALYAAFLRGDIQTVLDNLTPDIDWQPIGPAKDFPLFTPRHGRNEILRFFEDLSESHTFTEFSPQEYMASGDKVVVLGHYAMTFNRSGRNAATDWAMVFTIREGKICRFREHTDSAKLVEAYRG